MIEDAASPFTQIGRIIRSHGLDGELKVLFEKQDPELIDELSLVYVRNNRGDFIPCRITGYRYEVKGNQYTFFVQFDHIADRTSAEELKDHGLFLEADKAADFFSKEADNESLMDFEVLNEDRKSLGLVIDTLDTGAQHVITVATTSGSLMIPIVDEFVVEIHKESKTIQCKNLQQLTDV